MTIQNYPDELDYVNVELENRALDDKSFVGTFCLACLRADDDNYELLRPTLFFMMHKYPADPGRLQAERHDRGL